MLSRFAISRSIRSSKNIEKIQTKKYSAQAHAQAKPYTALDTIPAPSVLSVNNLRVISQVKTNSNLVTVAVTVEAGPVNESSINGGISRLAASLLLEGKSSRGAGTLKQEIRSIGAIASVDVDREYTTLTIRCFPDDVNTAVGILGDAVNNRNYDKGTFEKVKSQVLAEYDASLEDVDQVMFDHMHNAAFQGTPLERPVYGDQIHNLTGEQVDKYLNERYTAPCTIVTAVGSVDQDQIVKATSTAFNNIAQVKSHTAKDVVDFVGSEVRIRDDEIHGLHALYALQGVNYNDETKEVFSVIQELLGSYDETFGGLNNNGAHLAELLASERLAHNYQSFQLNYKNNGIIGVKGFFHSEGEHDLDTSADMVLKEFQRIGKAIGENDVVRAKNNVISSAIHHWDNDLSLASALAKGGFNGSVQSLSDIVKRIANVDVSAVKKATTTLDDTCPVVVSFGQNEAFPDYTSLRNRTFWSLW